MLTFKCTKKVQDYLSLSKDDLADKEMESSSLLGAWYVNQLVIDRRKVFLFMNEKTLLSFIALGAKKSRTLKQDFPAIFLLQFFHLIKLLELPLEQSNQLIDDYFKSEFRKTDSRTVLGNMNELAKLYEHAIYYHGRFNQCDISEIIYNINQTPQRNLGWAYSRDIAKEILNLGSLA